MIPAVSRHTPPPTTPVRVFQHYRPDVRLLTQGTPSQAQTNYDAAPPTIQDDAWYRMFYDFEIGPLTTQRTTPTFSLQPLWPEIGAVWTAL